MRKSEVFGSDFAKNIEEKLFLKQPDNFLSCLAA